VATRKQNRAKKIKTETSNLEKNEENRRLAKSSKLAKKSASPANRLDRLVCNFFSAAADRLGRNFRLGDNSIERQFHKIQFGNSELLHSKSLKKISILNQSAIL